MFGFGMLGRGVVVLFVVRSLVGCGWCWSGGNSV